MTFTSWLVQANAMMKKEYAISLDGDAGLTNAQLRHFAKEFAEPAQFVTWFAEKYDLERADLGPYGLQLGAHARRS